MFADRWCIENSRLADSPSRRHGISEEKEQAYLQQTANLIQEMGRKLYLPLICINTAVLFTQRFYVYHPLTVFEKYSLGASALFLAAKVEEHPRKVEHVCQMARILGLLRKEVKDADYIQDLLFNENILLQTLGFELQVQHPHQHVLRLCQLFQAKKDLSQTSYILATYCLHLTKMCLLYKPVLVACLCIHMACKMMNCAVPISREGKQWFLYGDPAITEEVLEGLCDEFLSVLSKCPEKCKNKTLLANHENLVKKFIVDHTGLPVVKESDVVPVNESESNLKQTNNIMESSEKLVRSLHDGICNFASALSSQSSSSNNEDSIEKMNELTPQTVHKISTKSHSSEKQLHIKPTSSRSLLLTKVAPHTKSASHTLLKTVTTFDCNKNKCDNDLNQSKPSSNVSSSALDVNAFTDPASKKLNLIRGALSNTVSVNNDSFQNRKLHSQGEIKLQKFPSVSTTATSSAIRALPSTCVEPPIRFGHRSIDNEKAKNLELSTSSGSLKISIPRSRISGIQPLVPPHRPATPADVKTGKSIVSRIPATASMGSEMGPSVSKRFRPN